ncbi:hypothetical protein Tco_1338862 [Tanacetum coccineum]
MAQLKYCDKPIHGGVSAKPDEECWVCTEIVDFLKSAIANTKADGSLENLWNHDTSVSQISEVNEGFHFYEMDAQNNMLPNADLLREWGQIGYPTDGTFTFWKSFFTPQWRFLVHHLLHCISSKSGGWDQFGSNIATALICLSTGRVYNFSKLIFDGMVANLKSKTKFLMYPRFLQMILNIQTENKHLYLAVSLTKKIFRNMKRGFRGAPRPLLPSMLLAATNPIAGQEHAAVAQSQPSSSTPQVQPQAPTPPPIPTSTPPPIPTSTPPPIPTSTPPPIPTPTPPPIPTPKSPPPIPETEPTPDEHIYEEPSPVHHHFSPPQEQAPSQMPMDDLLHAVPKLISRIDSLEIDLKQTKLTMGFGQVKEEIKMILLDSSVQGLVTPPTTRVNTSGEEQVEEISPNTLEAAKTLSKVASLKSRSIDKGRRYKRRKETKGKKVVSSLDFQEEVDAGVEQVNTASAEQVNTASAEQVNTASGVNTGSIKHSTGDEQLSTGDEHGSTVGQDKGQREGKAPMIKEEAKQIHLDSLLAQRIAEEEELTEQQKKRKAQVQFEAQHYTNEDWDLIRAKIEANAELSKSLLGSELQGEDLLENAEDLYDELLEESRNMEALSQLKKLSFEEAQGKKYGTKTQKRLKDKKDVESKDDEPTKKSGRRRKQMARKGMHTSVDKNDSEDSDEVGEQEESTIESMDVYMLSDRKYPLSAEVCQTMLKMKLLDGKMNEDCYRLLKMMEKQAGIRK